MEKKELAQELEKIKQELEELKKKMNIAEEERSIKDLPAEAFQKVMEVSKDIVRSTTEIAEKALRLIKYSAEGAVEGAKRVLKSEEEKKEE
ncbi:hypothetical protein HRbin13_00046 [bacterium HR13]|nr:hypothetical protein HRbin13_00046 [bacterium HR13]